MTGSFAAGQELSPRKIADQLGVSFIPVREAMHTLNAEGLVETRAGRGATVAQELIAQRGLNSS